MVLQNTLKNVTSKWLGFLILFILIAFLNYNGKTLIFDNRDNMPVTVSDFFLKQQFPGFKEVKASEDFPLWNTVLNQSEEIAGYYKISENNRWNYTGYAGPVPIFIKLSAKRTISEILLLDNNETGRFLSFLLMDL
jgi:hypothetical protein